ncbi:MAG TPA: rhomboid family intramembrane serine protease [Mycobacteriales bacterium]|nr:rhomboid family intramembrane serine protease [Mycobacteriales bacterium]
MSDPTDGATDGPVAEPGSEPGDVEGVPTCYRHRDRETYVRCNRCDKYICPDCMHSAAVGFHCPDCVREANRTVRQRQTLFGGKVSGEEGAVTKVLIGLCVVVYVLQLSDASIVGRFADLPAEVSLREAGSRIVADVEGVAAGQYYRLLTSAFLHGSPIHIAFNMYALFAFGTQVERSLGHVRYLALYLLSALGGSTLSFLLAEVGGGQYLVRSSASVGASGAVFGLFGAYYVIAKRLRADTGQIVGLIVINLAIGFAIPQIDNWAHIGGLVTGVAVMYAISKVPRGPRRGLIQGVAMGAIALVVVGLVVYRTASLRDEFPVLRQGGTTVAPVNQGASPPAR